MKTLLIANRGEIACRVIRTAKRTGWRTVAIHSDLDAAALHVRMADAAVRVESYLDIDEVVAAARTVGATHVHPGYGFLSERAEFARAVEAAGITLVGPSGDVMDAMGRKDHARALAVEAGVPVVPSYGLDDLGFDTPRSSAAQPAVDDRWLSSERSERVETEIPEVQFPVLVKAAAGGGGKGMRVVRSAGDLAEAVAAARREAAKAFGDDTMLVEKYVESGRHIEVQVFGDSHGNHVHLFERDCSTQRRHQKVLEEAPAPTISPEQQQAITRAAVDLARQVGYTNAGTVEFLLDSSTGEFYFLEMNTRLQVEHPVTEEVVRVRGQRIDLVELQLRIASGEPIGFEQADVTTEGHAIEARVYAEDSFNGFLPQAGVATYVRWPGDGGLDTLVPRYSTSEMVPRYSTSERVPRYSTSERVPRHSTSERVPRHSTSERVPRYSTSVRVDHALESGQEVSTAYDPMLGKVIAWGPDREAARATLVHALDTTDIFGLTTNTGFLRTLLASDEFRDAEIDTAWLDRNEVEAPADDAARALAAYALAPDSTLTPGPWRPDGYRTGTEPVPTLVRLDRLVPVRRTSVDGVPARVLGSHTSGPVTGLTIELDGTIHEGAVRHVGRTIEVSHHGQRFVLTRPDPFADGEASAGDGVLAAPMPGTVLAVNVEAGQTVAEGETLGVMEAMKMEHAMRAPFAGTVTEVGAAAGDQVRLGAMLFVVEGLDTPPRSSAATRPASDHV